MSSVGKHIRDYRLALGMSQVELADRVGKRRSAIGNYECGSREPDLDTLKDLARVLGVSVTDLLEEEGGAEDDPWALREEYRQDPNRRILFSLARNGSAREVRQAVALIDAMKRANPEFYDGEDPA